MHILGIETSCDETSVAVVENGRRILSNIISSQIDLHRKTGGVVPEVAAREHVVRIVQVLEMALNKAGIKLKDIDLIAVTAGPGLLSSLIVGVNAAMTLALILKKPLIPVNHIEGHIYANWLEGGGHPKRAGHPEPPLREDKLREGSPKFPAAVLTVSGGHNELLIWNGHGEYTFLGATLDDAAGEAFDKVARLLGLPYPGGPEIQRAALRGDPAKYPFPRAWLPEHPWDFSFSGLKTAVLYLVKGCHPELVSGSRRFRIKSGMTTAQFIADVAASFQEAVCEVLATKLVRAAQKYRVREVHLAGGVSANARLREWVSAVIASEAKQSRLAPYTRLLQPAFGWPRNDIRLRYCRNLTLCTDNAAMIAAAGYFKYKKSPTKYKKWRPIIANPNLEISRW